MPRQCRPALSLRLALVLAFAIIIASPRFPHALASALTVTPQDGSCPLNKSCTLMLATIFDTDSSAPLAHPTGKSIDWGDGSRPDQDVPTDLGTPQDNHHFALSGTHTYHSAGPFTVTITVVDRASPTPNTQTVTARVTVGLAPLQITLTPPGGFTQTKAWSGQIAQVSDPNCASGPLTYSYTIDWGDGQAASSGNLSNAQCGTASSIPGTNTYQKLGTFTLVVSVTASDGAGGQQQQSVTVADAPLSSPFTPIAVQVAQGAPFKGVVVSFSDSDSNATPADYTVTIDWGDKTAVDTTGTVTTGTVTKDGASFQVSGAHTYQKPGTYTISVHVADTGGATLDATAQATVTDLPLSPSSRDFSATVNIQYSGVVAHFTDADPNGAPGDYAANIIWGDGGTSPGTIVAASGSGFDVSGTHTYAASGAYTVTTSVIDNGGGAKTTVTSTATVFGGTLVVTVAPQTIDEGGQVSSTIATFPAIGCGQGTTFSAQIDWGDGATGTADNVTGGCAADGQVQAAHRYGKAGSYTVTVKVTGSDRSNGQGQGTITVRDVPLKLSAQQITVIAGTAFSGVVAKFTDGGAPRPANAYTATIDWGDGSPPDQGSVTATPEGFSIAGTHKYAHRASYTLAISVKDDDDPAPATDSVQIDVAPAPLKLNATMIATQRGKPFAGKIATLIDSDPPQNGATYNATIDWGDGGLSSGTIAGAQGTFNVSSTHTYIKAGSFKLKVNADDGQGRTAHDEADVTVDAGTLSGQALPFSVELPNSYSGLVAMFSDSGYISGQTHHTATIDWGDGTTRSNGDIRTVCNALCTCQDWCVSGSHTYATDRQYTVTITITADDGRTLTLTTQATVTPAPPHPPFSGGPPPSTGGSGSSGTGGSSASSGSGSSSGGGASSSSGSEQHVASVASGSWRKRSSKSSKGSSNSSSSSGNSKGLAEPTELVRSIERIGPHIYRVEITSAAGTSLRTIARDLPIDSRILSIWRFNSAQHLWQAGYFPNTRAPVDFSRSSGGIELIFVFTEDW
jgi:PKD repeat protein